MVDDKIPCRVRRFRAGDVIRRSASCQHAIVIQAVDDGRHGILMQLPGGQTFEATIGQIEWEMAQLAGPRLVQVRRKGSNEIVWSAYLPDFVSASALWHELEGRNPRMFEVDIWPQHIDEKMALDDMGYYAAHANQLTIADGTLP